VAFEFCVRAEDCGIAFWWTAMGCVVPAGDHDFYKEIKKNGEFVLPGFGKLLKQKRKARTGFNPKTQQKIKIPAKTVVKFRVAKAAKDAVLGAKK
jgi:hypothetical protein